MSSSGAMNHTAVLGSSLHGGMLVVRLRVPQTMRDEFPDFDVLPLKEAKKIVEALERERDREEALRQERGGKENEVRLHEMD